MKKNYICPLNRVHKLASRDAILVSVSQVGGTGTNTPGGNFDSGVGGSATNIGSEDGARTYGSNNVWRNEW